MAFSDTIFGEKKQKICTPLFQRIEQRTKPKVSKCTINKKSRPTVSEKENGEWVTNLRWHKKKNIAYKTKTFEKTLGKLELSFFFLSLLLVLRFFFFAFACPTLPLFIVDNVKLKKACYSSEARKVRFQCLYYYYC